MTEETLFATALEKADPADRAAFLADACPDPEVRRRVEGLLAAHAAAGSFLDHPAVGGEPTSVLPPSDPDVTHTQAPTDPDATAAPHAGGRAADPDDALAFLKPSTRPGSLGRLDHYEVLDVLGTGGFGTVMKAFDTRLHRVVAVKVLAPQLAASGSARARFLREARTAAAVKDDHVVNVYAVSEPGDPVSYLVMEFVAGQTLQQKLEKAGPLPPKEVLRIGMQAARGLAAAHAQGLIHRDIKPANVLLENGVERVKITDFGLARAADDASISQSGVVAGTPMYMSPEQARGDTLDTRSDLFSLGSVLYALCTGRPPFRADTTLAVLKRVVEDEPRPVRDVNPEVPRWLADVVAKLHAKSPADRFQTAKEVADLLAGYLAELQQQGTVVSRVAAPRRKRVLAGTGWVWWFTVPLVLFALLSAAAVFGEGDPPDMMTRREVHFHLVNGFGFFAGVGLLAAALVSAVSRRWAIRAGAFTAAATVATAVNGALGLLAPLPPADVSEQAVVSLHLSDAAIQYRFDEQGPNLTGMFIVQHPFPPGEHWLWFKLGDRHYRTARFTVGPGGRPELDVAATAAGARATLDGRPLAVSPAAAQPGVIRPLQDLVGAKERERDAAKARFDAGQVGDVDLRLAELELADARATLTVAEAAGETAAAGELVRAAAAWRDAVKARVDAGMEPADALARADARVAEARVRLVRSGGTESASPPAAAQFEPAWLQGRWRVVAAERGGAAVPVADLKSVDWIEFRGDRQTTFWNGRTWDGTFTLSASGPVAEIDLTSPEHPPVKMLARFDGNQLVMAQGLPGRPRPGGFETGPTTDFAVARYTRAPLPAVAPFTPAQATAHQEAWAAHLGVPVEFAHPSGVAFRLVPPGEFGMGFTDAELAAVREELKTIPNVGDYQRFAAESSGPRHTVRITRPFYLAKYETTAGQFRRFLDTTKHRPTGTIDWQSFVTPGQEDRQPVIGVSWDDAVAFGRWLGAGYELPTEAQWEYAARAGGPGLWSFGDDPGKLIDHAAVGQSGAKPGPVGLKTANGFGLFDLHGGADEWCRDWHVADYYRRSPVDDPVNLDPPTDPGTGRASRGGSWNAPAVYAKAAFRSFDHPTRPALPKGFRVALTGDLKAAVDAARGPTPTRPEVPFDALDPAKIPPEERVPWLPPGTVAVIGSHRGVKYDAGGRLELGPDKQPVAPPADPVTDRYFCPVVDGGRVITFFGGPEARSWSVRDGAFHPDGVTFPRPGSAPGLSPGGRLLAGYQPTTQLSVLERVGDRFERRTLLGKGTSVPGEQVVQYAWHPNGTSLVAANADGTVDLWDLSPGRRAKQPLGSFPKGGPLAISPDGKTLARGNALWGLTGPAPKARELPAFGTDTPRSAVFTPAGRLVVGYTSNAVRVFDPADPGNKAEVLCQPGEGGTVFWLSPDGRRLLIVAAHPRVVLWDLTTRELVLTLTRTETYFSPAHVSWADDSRHFVWGQNGVVYVIRVPDRPAAGPSSAKN